MGFTIGKVLYGEWLPKMNEEVFMQYPELYFDMFVDSTRSSMKYSL